MQMLEASMVYSEFEAMERFGGLSETTYYALPRDARARMVAKIMIDGFMSVYRQWEGRPKGK